MSKLMLLKGKQRCYLCCRFVDLCILIIVIELFSFLFLFLLHFRHSFYFFRYICSVFFFFGTLTGPILFIFLFELDVIFCIIRNYRCSPVSFLGMMYYMIS